LRRHACRPKVGHVDHGTLTIPMPNSKQVIGRPPELTGAICEGLLCEDFSADGDLLASANELRVCAARSRRRSSVGRTRGGGRRLTLWRFYQGRWLPGLIIAAQLGRTGWCDRSIAVASGAFKTIGSVIWSKAGPSAALVAGDLRGVTRHATARPNDGGESIRF
jgi:hypothetical protein